jgi:hypothetical protein
MNFEEPVLAVDAATHESVHLANLGQYAGGIRAQTSSGRFFVLALVDQLTYFGVITCLKQVASGRHKHGVPPRAEASARFFVAPAVPNQLRDAYRNVYGH